MGGAKTARSGLAFAVFLVLGASAGAGGVADLRELDASHGSPTADQLAAFAWLAQNTPPTTLVASSTTEGGGVLGWWSEGLAQRRTLAAQTLDLAAFPQAQQQAAVANAIFDDPAEVHAAALAVEYGASYLLVDGVAPSASWFNWGHGLTTDDHLVQVFHSGSVTIFQVEARVLTPRQTAIAGLYREVLGREADAKGLAELSSRDLSLTEIRTLLFCSDESRRNFSGRTGQCEALLGLDNPRRKAIFDLYQKVLGRRADQRDLDYYDASQFDLAGIERDMRCSAEYRSQHPDANSTC